MFRPVMQMSAAVKLRIGFIVQNKNQKHNKLSSMISSSLNESAFNINMVADVEVLSAEEALAVIDELDGLFISGKQVLYGKEFLIKPSETEPELNTLLQQAVEQKIPVLSTSNGFMQMNNALLNCSSKNSDQITSKSVCIQKENWKQSSLNSKSINTVKFVSSGMLARMFPGSHYQQINIDDQQVLNHLSPLLTPEGHVDNQTVVAFSLANKNSFYLAVNWKLHINEQRIFLNQQLIKSFILACRKFNKMKALA